MQWARPSPGKWVRVGTSASLPPTTPSTCPFPCRHLGRTGLSWAGRLVSGASMEVPGAEWPRAPGRCRLAVLGARRGEGRDRQSHAPSGTGEGIGPSLRFSREGWRVSHGRCVLACQGLSLQASAFPRPSPVCRHAASPPRVSSVRPSLPAFPLSVGAPLPLEGDSSNGLLLTRSPCQSLCVRGRPHSAVLRARTPECLLSGGILLPLIGGAHIFSPKDPSSR